MWAILTIHDFMCGGGQEFALNRINDTAIAIVVVLVVEQLFWPQWSSRLVRQEVHANLKAELESFMELEHTYTRVGMGDGATGGGMGCG